MIKEYLDENIDEQNLNPLKMFQYGKTDNAITIDIPCSGHKMELTKIHLKQLVNGKRLKGVPGLKYHNHCGFSFYKYSEFFVSFGDPYGPQWSENDSLYFTIGGVGIAVGLATPYMALLLEPYYREHHIGQDNFVENLATIKLHWVPSNDVEMYIHNVLFYLNYRYLKPFKLTASIYHLLDPNKVYELYDISDEPKMEGILRKRIRSSKPITCVEPLILFNNAVSLSSESQFLEYYRVLEFYFDRNLSQRLSLMRFDKSITNNDIIGYVKKVNEKTLLSDLLSGSLSSKDKIKFGVFAKNKKLCKTSSFDDFVIALYNYRCSIVHSKESKKGNTYFPRQVNMVDTTKDWNTIMRSIAVRVIRKMESK